MYEKSYSNSLVTKNSVDNEEAVDARLHQDVGSLPKPTIQSTYAKIIFYLRYTKMFIVRLGRDVYQSVLGYIYTDQVIPEHIRQLKTVQLELSRARDSPFYSSEDDFESRTIQTSTNGSGIDTDASINAFCKELVINNSPECQERLKNYYYTFIKPTSIPSTSKETPRKSESIEEVELMHINLQSEHDVVIEDGDISSINNSAVLAYVRDREPIKDKPKELSEDSLDVHIPSYPTSPREISFHGQTPSKASIGRYDNKVLAAVEYLHRDIEFLMAAEVGNEKLLDIIIRKGTDIQQKDHLGRNALHLAVTADSYRAICLLLNAGVDPTVKDNLGMTPLSLCLMRRPSLMVANLLFEHGAKILPRTCSMDTGLFMQFVMMCQPTKKEEKILELLVEKGASVNDPNAPGGRQALHFAAMSNNCTLIQILVDLNADLFMVNHRNQTPRDVAMTFGCREAQNLLEELECDSDAEAEENEDG